MKKLKPVLVVCPVCDLDDPRSSDNFRVYKAGTRFWAEVRCICGEWISTLITPEHALDLASGGAVWVNVERAHEKRNETGPMVEGYIQDFIFDIDDDPRLIAVLEKEMSNGNR